MSTGQSSISIRAPTLCAHGTPEWALCLGCLADRVAALETEIATLRAEVERTKGDKT